MEQQIVYTEDISEAMSDRYLDCCLHLVVLEGEASFALDGVTYHVRPNDCIIKPGASPITDISTTDAFRMRGVVISNEYLRTAQPKTHYEVKGMMSMLDNPVMPMLPTDTERIVSDIEDIRRRHELPFHLFQHETVRRAVELMILDMYDIHARDHADDIRDASQSVRILRQFISYLQTGMYRQERQVDYYASLLCITPKYLSEACIAASGHNASFWIDRFTSQEIARVLQEESSTMQDIADRFRFRSVNYFTRYVKRTLGMTPSDYRAKYSVKRADEFQIPQSVTKKRK